MKKHPYQPGTDKTRRMGKHALSLAVGLVLFGAPALTFAQTGVDDDRVSLPEGPGSLEGVGENIEIDPNMGSMRYSVPIAVPKGLNGLTPSLGLNYSSSAGSSVLGVGWTMPMMSIERMTMRGTPEYIPEDYFAANGGDELVLIESADGKQVYRERFEGSFVRYTWHDVGDGKAGYWVAEYPDGTVGYFGADSSGNIVADARSEKTTGGGTYKYHLVEKVDPYGHKIVYEYDNYDSNWPLVSSISYVYDQSTGEPVYRVTFDYEDRDDLLSDAGAGYEELLTKRLTNVQVTSRSKVVREYVLSYEASDDSGGFSRLSNVKRYGVGGESSGKLYPIEFTFGYSNALGVACTGNSCDSPYLVNMGTIQGASGLATGKATLLDINADSLPDILDTTEAGAHKIMLNRLSLQDGGVMHTFDAPSSSAMGTGSNFGLGNEITQVLDVNGDGLSDLVNASSGATILAGYGLTDWNGTGSSLDTQVLRNINISEAKFLDYNNDKRIDVMTSTGDTTIVYENMGDSFQARTVDPIGVPLSDSQTVQLADMNGDGYNDVVEIQAGGAIRYRLNYGWGKWSAWRNTTGVSIDLSERELVDLEDVNGDGISDVVVVTATQVKYAINRNGDRFDPFVTVASTNIVGNLPERQMGDKVLYADMNANGSEDVVWFDTSGQVQYLELFPTRPNLLSRIDNGIGFIQKIDYTTAALQEATARAEGEAWDTTLSIPMNIVAQTDTFVTLTGEEDGSGLHEIATYTYRDGFYDGVQKQFRGFETVTKEILASDAQEGGITVMTYNLGKDEPHYNGLLLEQTIMSGGRVIRRESNTYETCDLSQVPTPDTLLAQDRFAIYFPCMKSMSTVIEEGAPQADWVTTMVDYDYDGYGNITLTTDHGVVGQDGDEAYTETEWYEPGDGSAWFLRMPLVERNWNTADGSVKTEVTTYYDGSAYIGQQDEITHGFITRKTTKADDNTLIETLRQRRDLHGNVIESIDPNGEVADDTTHRRRYIYDDLGLFLTYLDIIIAEDHVLRRSTQYEYDFQKLVDVTDWVLIQGGQEVSSRNEQHYEYDDFGRMVEHYKAGDGDSTPTFQYTYELGEPFSRIIVRSRSERNGPVDEESYKCLDGMGRLYQSRNKTDEGKYLVTGFNVFNNRGAAVETFQPYTSGSPNCESERPAGVLSSLTKYDALFRQIEVSEPGEDLYGERLVSITSYAPLKEIQHDFEDLDPESPHYDTPSIKHLDGLGRTVALERTLAGGVSAVTELHYDETGSFSGYTDAQGNRHELVVDLAGRVTAVRNPTTGESTFTYDDAGNITSMTDSRGVTTNYTYDGGNRRVEFWDAADKEGTLVSYHYDTVPEGCELVECTNPANRLAMVTYPTLFGQGSDRIGYDARQRIVFQGRRLGDAIDMQTKITLDNLDRASKVTFSDGSSLEREYDELGRVVSVKGLVDDVRYSERGLLDTISYVNGASGESVYDALARLEARINRDGSGKIIDGMVMDRDREGNILSIEDMSEADMSYQASFEYDAWYRVTSATQKHGARDETMTYAFDLVDRITAAASSLDAASAAHVGDYAYDSARPLLPTTAGSVTLGFDATGQLTSRDELELEWDFMNRITMAKKFGEQEQHVYGSEKSRVAIVGKDKLDFYGFGDFEVRDGVSSFYLRIGGERLAKTIDTSMMTVIYEDKDGDDTITSVDAWMAIEEGGNGKITPEHVLGAVAARMLADEGDEATMLHTDYLGNIVSATDMGGEVIGHRAFNTTGVVQAEIGHVDRYGFTSQEHNDFTGLIQFKMRDFDPQIARWTSFDPAFVKPDVSAMSSLGEATTGYAYVSGNFVNSIDPNGLTEKTKKGGNNNGKNGGGKGGNDKGSKDNNNRERANSDDSVIGKDGMNATPGGFQPDAATASAQDTLAANSSSNDVNDDFSKMMKTSGLQTSNGGVDNTPQSVLGSPSVKQAVTDAAKSGGQVTIVINTKEKSKEGQKKMSTKAKVALLLAAVVTTTVGSGAIADGADASFAPTDLFSF